MLGCARQVTWQKLRGLCTLRWVTGGAGDSTAAAQFIW